MRPNFKLAHFVYDDLQTAIIESTTHRFNEHFLPEILTQFEQFLRGAGFVFDGHLDIIDDE